MSQLELGKLRAKRVNDLCFSQSAIICSLLVPKFFIDHLQMILIRILSFAE